jgi:hypothetical protein
MIAARRVARVVNRVGVCLPAGRGPSKDSDVRSLLNWRTEYRRGFDRSEKFFAARKAYKGVKEMHE